MHFSPTHVTMTKYLIEQRRYFIIIISWTDINRLSDLLARGSKSMGHNQSPLELKLD